MRLTIDHAHFWAQRRAPVALRAVLAPKSTKDAKLAIHACINAHAAYKPYYDHNAITLVRGHRNQRAGLQVPVLGYLLELGGIGWCFHNLPNRAARCRRWARKVARTAYGPEIYAEVCARLQWAEHVAQIDRKPMKARQEKG